MRGKETHPMVRSLWRRTLVAGLAWTGIALGQQPASNVPAASAAKPQRTLTVQEPGRSPLKCKLVRSWKTADGVKCYQVQAIDSGEMLTIVENGMHTQVAGTNGVQAVTTKIYHWGSSSTPPAGTPVAPPEEPKTVAAPKVPEQPKIVAAPKTPEQPKTVVAPKAPEQPKIVATPKTPELPSLPPPPKPATAVTRTTTPAPTLVTSPYGAAPTAVSSAPVAPVAPVPPPTPAAPSTPSLRTVSPPSTVVSAKVIESEPAKPVVNKSSYFSPTKDTTPAVISSKVVESEPAKPVANKSSYFSPTKDTTPAIAESKPVANKSSYFSPGKDTTPAVAESRSIPSANPLPEIKQSVMTMAETKEKTPAGKSMESTAQTTTRVNWWSTKGTAEPKLDPSKVEVARMTPVLVPAKPEPTKVEVVTTPAASMKAAQAKPVMTTKVEAPRAPASPSEYMPGQPLGVQSVIAAGAYDSQTPVSLPTPVLSIPQRHPVTPPQSQQVAMRPANEYEVNAFTPPGMMVSPGTPATPQAQAVVNAFTPPPPAMLPPQMSTPVTQASYGGAPGTAKSQPAVSHKEIVKQMATSLHDSLLPSQREAAAECLANLDWHEHPDAVLALTQAAKEDPAVCVRTCCIRGLAKMNVRTAAVLTTLEGLRTDGNAKVRQEAEEALACIGK
jgi:hypothetical protein